VANKPTKALKVFLFFIFIKDI
jgi:hypothetical protein